MPETRNINWVRSWPGSYLFTTLAVVVSVVAGAALMLYQYQMVWTPLEREYLRAYLISGIELSPLPHEHLFRVLVRDNGLAAVQEDIDRRRLVSWAAWRMDDRAWHEWLRANVYEGLSAWGLARTAWLVVALELLVSVPFGIWLDIRRAKKRRDGIVLRGARLVSRTAYHLLNRKADGIGWLTGGEPTFMERCVIRIGDQQMVRIPKRLENHHFVLAGAPGAGKTNLMLQMARQVRVRNERAVIYDPEREFVEQLYDASRDVILNPFDARCPAWNPSDEIVSEGEAMAVAKATFPEIMHGRKEEPFFINNARRVFKHLLEKRPGVIELWKWIAFADEVIDGLVTGTELAAVVTGKAYPQRAGVLGVLSRANEVLGPLKRVAGREQRWSAGSWVEDGGGFIFITSMPTNADQLRPFITLLLDVLIMKLRARERSEAQATWLFMDEIASLDTLPQLPTALAMARKADMRIVIGIQNRSQLEMRYDQEAETIISAPSTKLILRLGDSRLAEWGSKLIGDQESEDMREGRSWGGRTSRNASTEIRIRPAVMPSEIQALPDNWGFLVLPGMSVKLNFPYVRGELLHQGFIPSMDAVPPALALPPDAPIPAVENLEVELPDYDQFGLGMDSSR